ncbi:MAG: glycosyltransferase family 39 protein, partial [Akkermansiaceae bacterium]|nr:glycosyltransferase family 39 protein [Verrucomicrobiales bacterium]
DESEQLLATQQLQWGYGPQPPLYTWLLYPFVRLLGPGVLALAIFKNALLFGIYAVTFANARRIFSDLPRQVVATVSLLFLPQIAWESQRDLSHSILVTFFAVLTFHVLLKLSERPRAHLYAVFGLCLGAGVLSKYSFLIFAAGLLAGAFTVPSFRRILWNWRILLSVLVALAVLAPHLVWAEEHAAWVMATSSKLKITANQSWLLAVGTGLKNLLLSIGSHLGPIGLIYGVLCFRGKFSPFPRLPASVLVIRSSLLAMLAILMAGIFVFKITGMKDRWLMPLCVWMPLLLGAIFSATLNPVRLRRLFWIAASVALVVSILIPTRIWLAKMWGFTQTLNVPFAELAAELRQNGVTNGCFIAHDNWVGGNLKQCFPGQFVLTPNISLEQRSPETNGFLVWDAVKSEPVPPRLLKFASEFADVNTNGIRYVAVPMKFWPEKMSRLGCAPWSVNRRYP